MSRYCIILFFSLFTAFESHAFDDKMPMQGITISTHGGGRDWASDEMVSTLRDIKILGANWVATHPYAGISQDGSVRVRRFEGAGDLAPAHWTRPIVEAHKRGLKICIKPHLAYWRSGFEWRGEIAFRSEEEWTRFWADYRAWILAVAEACKDADAFVVGTELDKTLHHEAEWRALIADVRKVYKGRITYAANWTDYTRVPFWDALDAIGIQGYFPITKNQNPTETDLRSGWDRLIKELRAYAVKMNRNIVFTELGYNQSYKAASEPWTYRVDDDGARPLQEMCWRVALKAIENEPRITGALLWKWFPNPRPFGRDFQLATSRIMPIIAEAWQGQVPVIEFDEEAYQRWREQRRRGRGRRSNQN